MIRNPSSSPNIGFPLLLGAIIVLFGALSAIFPFGAVLLCAALVGGILILITPLHWIIVLQLLMVMIIAGSAEYFAGISQANWIPSLLGLLIGFRAALEYLKPSQSKLMLRMTKPSVRPWFVIPLVLYFLTILLSIMVNLPPLPQVLVGLKNSVFIWGVLAGFLVPQRVVGDAKLIWKTIVFVACIQLPVVLYQKFFIASQLSNVSGMSLSFDAINGTFGGGVLGGHSGAMVMTIIIALVFVGVAWRDRRISTTRFMIVAITALPSVFLAEVKAVVIWLGVAALIIFGRHIKSRPGLFLAGMLGTLVVIGGISVAYKTMYYEGSHSTDWQTVYDKQVTYFFDIDKFNPLTREMGRMASIAFWWKQRDMTNPVDLMIGHGLGASRGISSFAVGEVAQKFNFLIDTSAMTTLLWDVGLFGFLSFTAIILLGALEGYRISLRKNLSPDVRAGLECSAIGLLLILSTLIYNRDSIDAASIQFLVCFFLAIIWRGKASSMTKTITCAARSHQA